MNGTFYIGATGLDAQQKAVETVAHNIANMNTAAYKRGTVSFSELLGAGATAAATPTLAGVVTQSTLHVFTQGELRPTGNPMDLAIHGEGLLELAASDGKALLWRGGSLRVGADGYLTAANGIPLSAMISVPADAEGVAIGRDGRVTASVRGQREPVELGRLELALPADPQHLESLGDGLYRIDDDGLSLTRAAPGEERAGALVQGSSEASNIQLSDEMVSLMMYQRAYASNARLVQIGDELMNLANGLKR